MMTTQGRRTQAADAAQPAPAPPDPGLFEAGGSEDDRLIARLAYALGAERGGAVPPEAVETLRQQASRSLTDHAFRYLHNNVEQIRRDAVAEHLSAMRKPLGFVKVVLANLLALAIAALVGGWLALHPETLAGLAGLLTG